MNISTLSKNQCEPIQGATT